MGTPDWIDTVKSGTRRERRADAPVPQALPLLDKPLLDLLRRWVRSDAARRTYGALIKEAGPSGIERAEALCDRLLRAGWIIRCEQLTGGTWRWDALIWRDLPGRPCRWHTCTASACRSPTCSAWTPPRRHNAGG